MKEPLHYQPPGLKSAKICHSSLYKTRSKQLLLGKFVLKLLEMQEEAEPEEYLLFWKCETLEAPAGLKSNFLDPPPPSPMIVRKGSTLKRNLL